MMIQMDPKTFGTWIVIKWPLQWNDNHSSYSIEKQYFNSKNNKNRKTLLEAKLREISFFKVIVVLFYSTDLLNEYNKHNSGVNTIFN